MHNAPGAYSKYAAGAYLNAQCSRSIALTFATNVHTHTIYNGTKVSHESSKVRKRGQGLFLRRKYNKALCSKISYLYGLQKSCVLFDCFVLFCFVLFFLIFSKLKS